MGNITVSGVAMGATSLNITASGHPDVRASVPVTVRSRNLLSYGPAEGNGWAAAVNTDGSLHIAGTAAGQWQGLGWTFDAPVTTGTIRLTQRENVAGLSSSLKFYDRSGQRVGGQLTNGMTIAIPEGTVRWRLELLCNTASPAMTDTDLHLQVETGDTAHEWMRPDVTNLSGGLSLASLWPAIAGGTKNGVTLTAGPDGSYTTGGTWDKWTTFESTASLDAGLYTIEGSLGLTSLSSWDLILQVVPYPSGDAVIKPGTPSARLDAGRYRCQININSQGAIGRSVTPRLTRID